MIDDIDLRVGRSKAPVEPQQARRRLPFDGRTPEIANLSFHEVAAKYGEEIAIQAGIAADPDARELTEEDFAKMRPASEVVPHIVENWRKGRGRQKAPTKEQITIRLDAELTAHFRSGGPGWQTRINNTLREAVYGKTTNARREPQSSG